jgi:hypothetical protein
MKLQIVEVKPLLSFIFGMQSWIIEKRLLSSIVNVDLNLLNGINLAKVKIFIFTHFLEFLNSILKIVIIISSLIPSILIDSLRIGLTLIRSKTDGILSAKFFSDYFIISAVSLFHGVKSTSSFSKTCVVTHDFKCLLKKTNCVKFCEFLWKKEKGKN